MQKADQAPTRKIYYNFVHSKSSANMRVIAYGYDQFDQERYSIPSQCKGFFAVHLVLSGRGFYICNGQKYALCQGHIFFVPSDVPVQYYPDFDDPWEYVWMAFVGIDVERLFRAVGLTAQTPVCHTNSSQIRANLLELLDYDDKAASIEYVTLSHLYLLLGQLADEMGTQTIDVGNYTDNLVLQALHYISDHYSNPKLNIDDISQSLSISTVYLSRLFRAQMHTSISQYIISLRISKACELLQLKDRPIKSVAYQTGFTDAHYFSRVFHKHLGMPPTVYTSAVKIDTCKQDMRSPEEG